jgi:hypothetical protein
MGTEPHLPPLSAYCCEITSSRNRNASQPQLINPQVIQVSAHSFKFRCVTARVNRELRKNNHNRVACELARAYNAPAQYHAPKNRRPAQAPTPRRNNHNLVACELARAYNAPAQHHALENRRPAQAPTPRRDNSAISTPLLDKLQLAAIDQMRQAIAGHIGIEAFGL